MDTDICFLFNANKQSLFQRLDHVTLLSLGLVMPLNFQLYPYSDDAVNNFFSVCPNISLRTVAGDPGMTETEIFSYWLPFADYELSINEFRELSTSYITASFQLRALLTINLDPQANPPFYTPRVSMLNVPAALDGLKFRVPVFAKIQHNLTMSAVP
jgi:hypothetical protein